MSNGSTLTPSCSADTSVAGLDHYDVDVSVDGGAWQSVVANTQATSTNYTAQQGQSYVFRVIVTDNLGRTAQAETGAQGKRVTKYYAMGAKRVAMRADSVVYYLHGDHLGSTSLVTDQSQGVVSRQWYAPYGSVRASEGTLPTDFTYTGQRADATGLMYFRARYYSSSLGRFVSADTIVPSPGNPQSLNRYSYVLNSPLKFIDPTGHHEECDFYDGCGQEGTWTPPLPPPPQPPIVSRSKWGALPPGARVSLFTRSTEGFYDRNNNPGGYARYSDLHPDLPLADILNTIVIHHEGNNQTYDIRAVQRKHLQQGWADIGYHYIVGPNGIIYEGRDVGVRGAHVEAANTGKIGVLLLGDFQPGPTATFLGITIYQDRDDLGPTLQQAKSTQALIRWLDYEYGIDSVVGHRALNVTECPGDYAMSYIPVFDRAAQEDER